MSIKLSDELNQIVLGTADYIEHLPDKTNIAWTNTNFPFKATV